MKRGFEKLWGICVKINFMDEIVVVKGIIFFIFYLIL